MVNKTLFCPINKIVYVECVTWCPWNPLVTSDGARIAEAGEEITFWHKGKTTTARHHSINSRNQTSNVMFVPFKIQAPLPPPGLLWRSLKPSTCIYMYCKRLHGSKMACWPKGISRKMVTRLHITTHHAHNSDQSELDRSCVRLRVVCPTCKKNDTIWLKGVFLFKTNLFKLCIQAFYRTEIQELILLLNFQPQFDRKFWIIQKHVLRSTSKISSTWTVSRRSKKTMILTTCQQNYRAQTFVSDTFDE